MPNVNRKIRKQATSRVIVLIEGDGVRDGWMTVRLPLWLLAAIALTLLVAAIAMELSPDIAANVAFALVRLASLMYQSRANH